MAAFKHAWLSVKAGEARHAVAVASVLRAEAAGAIGADAGDVDAGPFVDGTGTTPGGAFGGDLSPAPGSEGGSANATLDTERSERTASKEAEFRRLMIVVGLPDGGATRWVERALHVSVGRWIQTWVATMRM